MLKFIKRKHTVSKYIPTPKRERHFSLVKLLGYELYYKFKKSIRWYNVYA